MKSRVALLLSAASIALAVPTQQIILPGGRLEVPDEAESKLLPLSWPGIDLDLDERRLIQLEGAESPVWMTELEKVRLQHRPSHYVFSPGDPDSCKGSGREVL
jgi:hypothetical protein